MKHIKVYLFFLALIGAITTVSAQDKGIYGALNKLIKVNDLFYTDKYYDKGFLFSISIGVNPKGIIDTVMFSHYRNDELGQLINFNEIKNGLKKNKTDFLAHKNEMLVLLVMIIRGGNALTMLTNGNQLRENWINIIDSSRELSKRKQFLLTPMLISSTGKKGEF
ncbi:MAG: hypothetical protein V4541_00235 [Bacteroidota bacterium]